MKNIKASFLVISVLFAFGLTSASGQAPYLGPLSKISTVHFGKATEQSAISTKHLRLLVWNIHKAADESLAKDFSDISYGADLVLFQEAVSERSFAAKLVAANPTLGWTLAVSFAVDPGNYTGVATGSKVQPDNEYVIVSNAREPITSTPKTILLSEYFLPNRTGSMLVANIHGINFVTTETFKTQIRQLFEKIRSHQGPLIVAGDFNTWNDGRMSYLIRAFAQLGLKQISTPDSGGLFSLDHIFVRGMKSQFVFNLNHIDSSDHKPLLVDLVLQ